MSIKKQDFDCIYEKHDDGCLLRSRILTVYILHIGETRRRVSIKKQVFDCIYEKHDDGCLLRSRILTVYMRNTTTGVY